MSAERRTAWRCRLFGHAYRDCLFGQPVPNWLIGEATFRCRRCGHEIELGTGWRK